MDDFSSSEFISNCFDKTLDLHLEELILNIDTSSEISTANQGRNFGYKIALEITEQLINNCDTFFSNYEQIKLSYFEHDNEDSLRRIVKKLDSILKEDSNNQNSLQRRGWSLMKLKKMKAAKKDFLRLIELDPSNPLPIFYLGIIEEFYGSLEKSLEYYNLASELSEIPVYKIFTMMVRRKLNEQ